MQMTRVLSKNAARIRVDVVYTYALISLINLIFYEILTTKF